MPKHGELGVFNRMSMVVVVVVVGDGCVIYLNDLDNYWRRVCLNMVHPSMVYGLCNLLREDCAFYIAQATYEVLARRRRSWVVKKVYAFHIPSKLMQVLRSSFRSSYTGGDECFAHPWDNTTDHKKSFKYVGGSCF